MAFSTRQSDTFQALAGGDFVVRRHMPAIWKLLILFGFCFSLLFSVAIYADTIGGYVAIALAIFAVIGPLSWYTIYFSQRTQDMLMATEYQNALFSAAARLKSRFCLIIKQDGTLVYYDHDFQKVFPETANRGLLMLDKIFSTKYITPAEADKLYKALEKGVSETVLITLGETARTQERIILSIEPIPRPTGYFILRGRDYVAKQYESQAKAAGPDSQKSGVHNLEDFVHQLPFGIYMTDSEGKIQFINYRLESWLGFDQNEAVGRGLTLVDLVPEQNTPLAQNLLLKDCEGEIRLYNKQRQMVQLHITQQVKSDTPGNLKGSIALLQIPSVRLTANEPTAKDGAGELPGQPQFGTAKSTPQF